MNCVRSEHVEHRITRIQLGLIHFPEASPDLDNLQLSVAHFLHFLHIDVTRSQIESEGGKIETEWSHLTMTAPGRSPGGASKACQRIRRASQLSHGVGDDGAPEKHVRVLNLCKRFFFSYSNPNQSIPECLIWKSLMWGGWNVWRNNIFFNLIVW